MHRWPVWRSLGAIVAVCGFLGVGLQFTGVREVHRTGDVPSEVLADVPLLAHDWPAWRGPSSDNRQLAAIPPTHWSPSENIQWKTAIPGRGHSSPCVRGEQLFLTTADDDLQTIELLCLDRQRGSIEWKTELHRGGFIKTHTKNTHASSSPACDGRTIYIASAVRDAVIVSAVDRNGGLRWQTEAGSYVSEWGYGSSVALHGSLVFVSGDNRGHAIDRVMGTSWLAALHRETGQLIWRVKRTEGDSFGTPIVATICDRTQLVLAGKDVIVSYDPETGDVLWSCRWNGKRSANTVAFDDRHVYASTRQPQSEMVCVRADGTGDVTETHRVWQQSKLASDVPSPCFADGRLFVLQDDGILGCVSAADGRLLWKKRLGGTVSSSPLLTRSGLFCCTEEGKTFVLDPTSKGETLAENMLDGPVLASPVVSGERLYLRTTTHLYCLADPSNSALTQRELNSRKQ